MRTVIGSEAVVLWSLLLFHYFSAIMIGSNLIHPISKPSVNFIGLWTQLIIN